MHLFLRVDGLIYWTDSLFLRVDRLMYWTDKYAQSPKIESAWMTGENRTTLVSTRLGQPTGLSIDYHMNHRVYWCDSKENIIESMKFDGTDRAIVIRSGQFNMYTMVYTF